jgi:hypothetical protein
MHMHNLYYCVTVQSVILSLFLETEDQHDSAKAQEAFYHLACFPLSREEISQPRFELPTYDWGEPVATQNMIFSV